MSQVGGERLEVVLHDAAQLGAALEQARGLGIEEPSIDARDRRVTVPVDGGAADLRELLARLDRAAIGISEAGLRRPTLDDVFLSLTGHAAEAGTEPTDDDEEGAA
jgi:ABC-2 type transport system ATP-binding protein